MNNNKRLIAAAETGQLSEVQRLLGVVDDTDTCNEAFVRAGKHGQLDCLKELRAHNICLESLNAVVGWAALHGHTECLEYVMNRDQHSNGRHTQTPTKRLPLELAAQYRNVECVKLLIGVSSCEAGSAALIAAAKSGCVKSVELLLQGNFEFMGVNLALYFAALNTNCDCVDALYPLANVQQTLEQLNTTQARYKNSWRFLEERYCAEQQNIVLNTAVETSQPTVMRVSKL